MSLVGDILYVADTENHLLRRANLHTQQVETLAGTGKQAGITRSPLRGAAREVALSSPWDLLCSGNNFYIAMAGLHQVHILYLDRGIIEPFAGNGHEGLRDDLRSEAMLAQPNGLALREDGRVSQLCFQLAQRERQLRSFPLP